MSQLAPYNSADTPQPSQHPVPWWCPSIPSMQMAAAAASAPSKSPAAGGKLTPCSHWEELQGEWPQGWDLNRMQTALTSSFSLAHLLKDHISSLSPPWLFPARPDWGNTSEAGGCSSQPHGSSIWELAASSEHKLALHQRLLSFKQEQ